MHADSQNNASNRRFDDSLSYKRTSSVYHTFTVWQSRTWSANNLPFVAWGRALLGCGMCGSDRPECHDCDRNRKWPNRAPLLLLLLFFFFRLLFPQFLLSRALRSNLFPWEQRAGGEGIISYLIDSTFRKRLNFWSSSMLMFPGIFSSYFPWSFLSRPSAPLATGTVSLETNINSTGNRKKKVKNCQ